MSLVATVIEMLTVPILTVLFCPVPLRSLGCAIVEFADIEGAARAVRALHDTDYGGRPLQVREDREDKKVFN